MANASQVTSYSPWATASPYLTDILGRAQSLYGQQAPLYANPAANFGFGQATGAVGSALGGNTTLGGMASQISPIAGGNISSQFANPFGTTGNLDATGAIRQALSGTPDYSAVNGALDAANTQQWNQLYNQVIPQLNQRASFLGNPSGAIKDLNSAVTQIGQNQSLNAQQAYLGQYNLAKQQQQQAASLVANGGLQGQSNALGLGGLAGQLAQGQGSQSLQAAQLFPGISTLPQQNLNDYASIVGNATGRYGTQNQTVNPGSGQTIANVLGGLTAGAGLYNTLFPQNGSGLGSALLKGGGSLLGGISGLFGSGSSALNNYLNNGNSTAIVDQYGSNGIMADTPFDWSTFSNPTLHDVGMPDTSQWDTGNINWGDGQNPSSAGGEAATTEQALSNFQTTSTTPSFDAYQATAPDTSNSPSMGSMVGTGGNALGTIGAGLGIVNGVRSGSPVGYASAGLGAAKLAASNNAFGSDSKAIGGGVGLASNALGIYGGIKQGGVAGDSSAAVNAAQLGSRLGVLPGAVGTAAGYVAAPLAVYNFAKNYQSGATGSDAMNGATAGATVGGAGFGPVGAVAGGVIGGAIGAIASAFGPGAKDPETVGAQQLLNATSSNGNNPAVAASVSNPYLMLQGLMDQHHSDLPIFQKYGRADALGFTKDMTSQINSALKSGTISKSDSPNTVYQKVVQPWVQSMGDWDKVGSTYKSTVTGLLQNMTSQYMNGQQYGNPWTNTEGWSSIGGENPFLNLTPFGGTTVAMPTTANSSPGRTGGITRRN